MDDDLCNSSSENIDESRFIDFDLKRELDRRRYLRSLKKSYIKIRYIELDF